MTFLSNYQVKFDSFAAKISVFQARYFFCETFNTVGRLINLNYCYTSLKGGYYETCKKKFEQFFTFFAHV